MDKILKKMGFPIKPSFRIDSKETLQEAAESFGILPFFPNNVKGLSVEEMCSPGLLFGGNYEEGCWEWKGPVIRRKTTAYGKFFRRKAGFVSLDILPDFLNYRRKTYPVKEGGTEELLLDIIRENDSLSSTELKKIIFGRGQRTNWDELPEISVDQFKFQKSKSLESPLQRLQMGGRIIINDFEYKRTKSGERYGWGVARYSTPEIVFGNLLEDIESREPEESLERIIAELRKKWPASKKDYELLLK